MVLLTRGRRAFQWNWMNLLKPSLPLPCLSRPQQQQLQLVEKKKGSQQQPTGNEWEEEAVEEEAEEMKEEEEKMVPMQPQACFPCFLPLLWS